MMTLDEVRSRIAEIKRQDEEKRDHEVAHGYEDTLFQDVLRAIAAGQVRPNPRKLAAEALKVLEHVQEHDYPRWYA